MADRGRSGNPARVAAFYVRGEASPAAREAVEDHHLHFGHANIIGYSRRPFRDIEAMDDGLVARWNETVAPEDTVWVLGDVALGNIEDSLAHFGRLAGRKHLLAGNHDRCWAGHGRRADGWAERYRQAGFEEIHQGEMVLSLERTEVLACHFPYRGDSHDRDRYVEARPVDHGLWLLHGHVHERWRQRGRMINVGVDAWDYRPVSAATLAETVSSGPTDRPTSSDDRRP